MAKVDEYRQVLQELLTSASFACVGVSLAPAGEGRYSPRVTRSTGDATRVGDPSRQPQKRPKKMKQDPATKFPRQEYERELVRLQGELVELKEWVRTTGAGW
jgi:hypothetical protein